MISESLVFWALLIVISVFDVKENIILDEIEIRTKNFDLQLGIINQKFVIF